MREAGGKARDRVQQHFWGRRLRCCPPLLEDLWEGTSFSHKEFRLKAQPSQDAHPGLFSLFLGGSCPGMPTMPLFAHCVHSPSGMKIPPLPKLLEL